MKRDRQRHILRFLYVTDCNNEPDITDENSDRLWKMWNLSEFLNKIFSKFYSHIELRSVEGFVILFKEQVTFRQYVPNRHKRFGIKTYKPCDETGYTYMTIYSLFDGGEEIS
jgi:hypothetical protein